MGGLACNFEARAVLNRAFPLTVVNFMGFSLLSPRPKNSPLRLGYLQNRETTSRLH